MKINWGIMNQDDLLRENLLASLQGRNAHLSFEATVKDFPEDKYNSTIPGTNYSCWDLLEHIRIAQWDILDFIINPDYQHKKWPEDYWPKEDGDHEKWLDSVNNFIKNRNSLETMVMDKTKDLLSPIAHAPDYTIYREILLVIDHNSYHTGQLLVMRKALGIWVADYGIDDYS